MTYSERQGGEEGGTPAGCAPLLPRLDLLAPTPTTKLWLIVAVTIIGLAVAGIPGAWIAGTALTPPALRVVVGGGLAMLVTALVGQLVHIVGI